MGRAEKSSYFARFNLALSNKHKPFQDLARIPYDCGKEALAHIRESGECRKPAFENRKGQTSSGPVPEGPSHHYNCTIEPMRLAIERPKFEHTAGC